MKKVLLVGIAVLIQALKCVPVNVFAAVMKNDHRR